MEFAASRLGAAEPPTTSADGAVLSGGPGPSSSRTLRAAGPAPRHFPGSPAGPARTPRSPPGRAATPDADARRNHLGTQDSEKYGSPGERRGVRPTVRPRPRAPGAGAEPPAPPPRRRASPPARRHAPAARWRTPSCSWWRGASAASRTSPSRGCCSGAGGAAAGARGAGAGTRGPRPTPGLTRPARAPQGHLAAPEGPRRLPRVHQPPGAPPETDARRRHRLRRGQVNPGTPRPPCRGRALGCPGPRVCARRP